MTSRKAALWLRVSTDEQRTQNQVPELMQFMAHHSYELAETYALDDSAWNGGKDGGAYQAMLERAKTDAWQGKYQILVVWALDRLTRGGAEDALRLIRQFRERGCVIVSVQESWLNGSPEVQDVLVSFAGWMAKQESDRKSARIKAGLARRKAEGLPVGGRKAGAKDKRRRSTEGYEAAWQEGGARRTASAGQGTPE